MSTEHTEHRTFTREQQQAMYAFISKLIDDDLLENAKIYASRKATMEFKLVATVGDILDIAEALQTLASDPVAAPASQPAQGRKRYTVTSGEYGEYGASMPIYPIYDNLRKRHLDSGYRDKHEAEQAAAALNAGASSDTGTGG